jgi:hypothetical protein
MTLKIVLLLLSLDLSTMSASDAQCLQADNARAQRLKQSWTLWTFRQERRHILKRTCVVWRLCMKSRSGAIFEDGDDEAVVSAIDRLRATAKCIRASPRNAVQNLPTTPRAIRSISSVCFPVSFRGATGCHLKAHEVDGRRSRTGLPTEHDSAAAAAPVEAKLFVIGMEICRSVRLLSDHFKSWRQILLKKSTSAVTIVKISSRAAFYSKSFSFKAWHAVLKFRIEKTRQKDIIQRITCRIQRERIEKLTSFQAFTRWKQMTEFTLHRKWRQTCQKKSAASLIRMRKVNKTLIMKEFFDKWREIKIQLRENKQRLRIYKKQKTKNILQQWQKATKQGARRLCVAC